MRFFFMNLSILFLTFFQAGYALGEIRSEVEALFDQDFRSLDFAKAKIAVDQIIDPKINLEEQVRHIDLMVAGISTLLPVNADSWTKINAIQRYIYEPGPWNGGKVFSYDHDDPFGDDLRNKLLSDYIQDRRGNCITMPFLFIILGQRLGLDVRPAMAPLHVLVKFTDDEGRTYNLEATSGAGPARDQHYKNLFPITEKAIRNGMFLTALDNEKSMALMAAVIVEDLIHQKRYHEAISVADLLIEHFPAFGYMLTKKGTAAYYLLKENFYSKYPTFEDIPDDMIGTLLHLKRINQISFDRADDLGWLPMKR